MRYAVIPLLCIVLSVQSCEEKKIIVRPAHLDDIEHLNKLSEKQYQNDFKPLWEKSYVTLFQNRNIASFIAEKTNLNNENNEKIPPSPLLSALKVITTYLIVV